MPAAMLWSMAIPAGMITRTIETAPICDALGKPIVGAKATLISERSPIWSANNQTFLATPLETTTDTLGVARWLAVPNPAQEGWTDGTGAVIRDWTMTISVSTPPRAPDLPESTFLLSEGMDVYTVRFNTSELRTAGIVDTSLPLNVAVTDAIDAAAEATAAAASILDLDPIPNSEKGQLGGVSMIDAVLGDVLAGNGLPTIRRDILDKTTFLVTRERYPGLGSGAGITNSTAAILQAIADAPEFSRLVFEPGLRLRVDANLNNTVAGGSKNITLDGSGSMLIKDHNDTLFTARGKEDAPLAVDTITDIEITSESGAVNRGMTIALVSGTYPVDMVRGDLVEMVANDLVPGGRAPSGGNASRIRDWFQVYSMTPDRKSINVIGRRRKGEPFSLNPRIARFNPVSAGFQNWVLDTTANAFLGTASPMLDMRYLYSPQVRNVKILKNNGGGVNFLGCYGWINENPDFNFLMNDPANGKLGYGTYVVGSAYGCLILPAGRETRHTYSDDASRFAADASNFYRYGQPVGNLIVNGIGRGGTSSPWNTHPASLATHFLNCHVYGGREAFGLRGFDHMLIGCSATDISGPAIKIYDDDTSSTGGGHLISGFLASRVFTVVQDVMSTSGGARNTITGLTARDVYGPPIIGSRANLEIIGSIHLAPELDVLDTGTTIDSQLSGVAGLIQLVRTSTLVGKIDIDASAVTAVAGGGTYRVIDCGTAANAQLVEVDLRVRNAVATVPPLPVGMASLIRSNTGTVRHISALIDNDQINTQMYSVDQASGWVDYKVIASGNSSSLFTVSGTSVASQTAVGVVGMSLEAVVVLCLNPGGASRILAPVLPPNFQGQRMVVPNVGTTAGQTITLQDGPTTTLLALLPRSAPASVILDAGEVVEFIGDRVGSTLCWRQLGAKR